MIEHNHNIVEDTQTNSLLQTNGIFILPPTNTHISQNKTSY